MQVIQPNYYMTDFEKQNMLNGIASLKNKLEAYIDAHRNHTFDMVLQPGFRKGRKGIEEELRLKALAEQNSVPVNGYEQADTDWDVEAVEDEDDLFK